EDAGGEELELELLTVDDHGVAGVVATVGLDDVVDALSEQVGGLALPLVAPLGSDDHDGGHGDSWGRCCGLRTRGRERCTGPRGSYQALLVSPLGRRRPAEGQSSRLGSASRRKSVMRSASGWSPSRREVSPSSASARSTPRLGTWEAGI